MAERRAGHAFIAPKKENECGSQRQSRTPRSNEPLEVSRVIANQWPVTTKPVVKEALIPYSTRKKNDLVRSADPYEVTVANPNQWPVVSREIKVQIVRSFRVK